MRYLLPFLLPFLFLFTTIINAQTTTVTPKNGSYLPYNDINFSWNTEPSAVFYNLIISNNSDFSDIYLDIPIVTVNDTTITISPGSDYYWKVRSYNGSAYSTWSFETSFTVYTPESISGSCLFRLNADSVHHISNSIDTSYNYAGSSFYAQQATATAKPTLVNNVLNSRPVMRFDGGDYLNGVGMVGDLTQYSFFVVCKATEFANFRWIYQNAPFGTNSSFSVTAVAGSKFRFWPQGGSSSGIKDYLTSGNTTDFFQLSVVNDNSLSTEKTKLYNNGIADGTSNTNTLTHSDSGFKIGVYASGTNFFKGDIAELILFDACLNDSERFLIDNYLRYKFFPDKYIEPLDLGFDIRLNDKFCDTALIAYKDYFTGYLWSTGETDSIIRVNEPGNYSVTATDIFGFTHIDTIQVSFPVVASIPSTTFCYGDTIIWDTDIPGTFTFEWLNSSSVDSFLEIWEVGNYAVTITDAFGCSYTSATETVSMETLNIVDSLGADRSACEGQPLLLNGYQGVIESYHWSTGDVGESTTINATGNYSLTVTSSNGCESIDTIFITIKGVAPEINFSADTVCLGTATSFTDLSTVPSPDGITIWKWNLDNNIISEDQNFQFIFTEFGTFPVTLSLETDSGCTNILTKDIIIKNNPIAGFEILYGNSQCTGTEVSFINNSAPVSEFTSFEWLSESSVFSTDEEPVNTFINSGNYNIRLIVTDLNGCTDTSSTLLSVNSSMPLPSDFSTITPVNEFVCFDSNTIDFSWNESNGFQYYLFELSKSPSFDPLIISIETTNNFYSQADLDTAEYFWRVSAKNLCLESTFTSTNTFTVSEIDTTRISLWFDAGNDLTLSQDSLVSSWTDRKTGLVTSQLSSGKMPVLDTLPEINSQRVAKFDGTNDDFIVNHSTNVGSVFSVCNVNSTAATFATFRGLLNSPVTVTKSYIILSDRYTDLLYTSTGSLFGNDIELNNSQNLSMNPFKRHKIIYGNVSTPVNYETLQIGGAVNFTDRYWKGNIAEIIVFDTVLNDADRNNVYQYLRYKYSPPVNLGYDIRVPYGFCDTAITTAYKPWFTDYEWSTGETDSVIHVNRPGIYTVTVTDIFGFTSSDDIRVFYPEVNDFADTIVCYGASVVWDTELEGDYGYEWYGSSELTQAITITDEGQYAAILTDTLGCKYYSDTISFSFDNYEFTASVGPTDTSLCSGNRLMLITNAGETVLYNWSTGSTNPEIVLTESGTYYVTVNNWRGCEASDNINVTITGQVPFPSFSSMGHCARNAVSFTDESTTPDGIINNWTWRVNGNIISTQQNPEYTFTEPGTYNVNLSIITDNDCGDFVTVPVIIYPLPVVSFEPEYFCQNAEAEFISTSTVNEGSVVYNLWNFDSYAVPGTPVNFSFTDEGYHNIKLISSSEMSCTDSLTREVFVKPAEQPVYTASNTCLGEDVYFINTTPYNTVNPGENWTWDFGDGGSSSLSNPQHTYGSAGIFNTVLNIQYANKCVVSASLPVEVYFNPEATVYPVDACEGVVFSPESDASTLSGNIISYSWNIDTETPLTSVLQNPEFMIADTGSYNMSLSVLTDFGCRTTHTNTVRVHESPLAEFSASRTWGSVPLWIDFTNTGENAETYFWDFGDDEISTEENPYHIFADSGTYTVRLISTSAFGCRDSAAMEIKSIIPVMDVILYNLRTEMNDNYLQTQVYIINNGTLPVNNLDMVLNLGNGKIYREVIEYLAPSQVIDYRFTLEAYIPGGNLPDVICVEAVAPAYEGNTDSDLSNNTVCNTDVENLKVMQPYPNPATDQLTCEFIAAQNQDITVTLVNSIGGVVYKSILTDKEGYTKLLINVKDFVQGVYFLQVTDGNEKHSYKVEVQ